MKKETTLEEIVKYFSNEPRLKHFLMERINLKEEFNQYTRIQVKERLAIQSELTRVEDILKGLYFYSNYGVIK